MTCVNSLRYRPDRGFENATFGGISNAAHIDPRGRHAARAHRAITARRPLRGPCVQFCLAVVCLPFLLGVLAVSGRAQSAAGTALQFDGVDDYIEVPSDPALNAFPLTVTAWVKTLHNTNLYEGIVKKYAPGSANGYSLHLYNGRLYAWYFRSSANRIYTSDPGLDGGGIADGQWHHVAFVVGLTGGALYVDGNLRASQGWTGQAGPPTSTDSLLMGKYSVSSAPLTNSFQGQIDEVTLWNRALGAGEVNYLKHRRLSATEDGLVAYWRFDETAGSIVANTVGPALEGTLVNDPAWVPSSAAVALEPVAGYGLKLDGVDDYVAVAHAPDLDSFPLTVSAWVRTSRNSPIVDGIVSKYFESSLNGYSLFLYNGRVRGWYFRDSVNRIWDGSLGLDGGFIADGNWHHVALVIDNAGGRIVTDGVAGPTLAWTGTRGATTTTEPLQIGRYWTYANGLAGSIDEVTIWNRAFTAAELQASRNLLRTGSEPGLIAYWRFDDGGGASASDLTGLGHSADLQNEAAWVGSTAFLGDGQVRLVGSPGVTTFSRTHAINRAGVAGVVPAPGLGAFQLSARAFFRRFYDFGSPPASVTLATRLDAALQSAISLAPVAVLPNTSTASFSLSAYNASDPQPQVFGAVASLSAPLAVEPDGVQLDPVNDLYEATVVLSHNEDGGDFAEDGRDATAATRLLHFNGLLYSGDIPATFTNLANTPAAGIVAAPDYLNTQFQLPASAARLWLRPEVTFGGGAVFNVTLAPDGTATNLNGSFPIGTVNPLTTAGVRYLAAGLLSPAGASAAILFAFLPTGLGVQTNAEVRAQYPYLIQHNVPLSPTFEPATDPVIFHPGDLVAGSTEFYFAEETKPVLFSATEAQWNVAAGQFYLAEATGAQFVREVEDDWLERERAFLQNPIAGERVSNDSFYRHVAAIPGLPVFILPDPENGSARVQWQLDLMPVDFRPHLPYTGPEQSGPVPSAGGRLVIADDQIDVGSSYLSLAGDVPVVYRRDCSDTNCSGVTSPPAVMAFTPAPAPQLQFTTDGGLIALGSVPAQNLTWGYTGSPGTFAQRTSDVEAGAFHMPGTFLRGDQTAAAGALRPAVLLFTGYGDPGDATPERPGSAAYDAGAANYGGLNFRRPLQGRSTLAGRDTGWYPLVPQAKYYVRFGGVSGIHQAQSFPTAFPLSGYDMTFSRFALSYLDSDNWESRTDGRITFPAQPAGYYVDFQRMKFLCRGSLADAQLPPNTPEKHLNYWNTDFLPLSMEFRETLNNPCSVSDRYLVLGVETKLPFIPEKLHASLAFKPNGNLAVVTNKVRGVDSRFPLPAQLRLQGPGQSYFAIGTAGEGYFNNWEIPGRPDAGFYNIAGRIDLPFFEDSKIHLHVTPLTPETAQVDIMGGWRAADQGGSQYGWTIGGNNYFSVPKFDETHRGFPERSADGSRAVTLAEYRRSPVVDFHPRAQRNWIEVAIFDYPLVWNSLLRQFSSFEDSTVILPIINVDSRLKEVTPGKVDLDFAQDLELALPRIKLLDLANDAVNEINGPFNSLSNALRQAVGGAVDATGLSRGFRSLQRTLRDEISGFFRPVLEPALNPVADALYQRLLAEPPTTPALLGSRAAAIVNEPALGLQNAIRNINGAASQANSVAGQLNQTLVDIDNTLGLFQRILQKDGSGQRNVVRVILQKIAADQGALSGIVGAIADPIANSLLAEVEPTLKKVEERLGEIRREFNSLQTQLAGTTGDFAKALGTVTGNANALAEYGRLSGVGLSNLMAGVSMPVGDFLTANPTAARQALRDRLITAFLASPLPAKYQQTFKQFLYEDDAIVSQLTETIFQQINQSIRNGLSESFAGARDGIFAAMKGPGLMGGALASAQIRGAPTFNGDAMKKIRLDAKVKFKLPDDLDFNAYMEIRELDSQSVPKDCIPAGAPAAEIIIGAADVPLSWPGVISTSGQPLTLTIEARWTQQSGNVLGVGGLVLIKGEIGFKGCSVKEIGASLAFGELETYFAAKAAGTITVIVPIDVSAGLFVGKACSLNPLLFVDPEAGKVLGDPLGFRGLYVQFGGGLSLSEILLGTSSCFLDVSATITTATYYSDGPTSGKLGMRQKLALDLSLLCLISGHADLALFASAEFGSGGYELILGGEANLCGSLGPCPFCISGCVGLTIKGIVRDGAIDYSID